MTRLTWDNLLIQEITADQFRKWLAPWTGVVTGRVALAFLNKFGWWFMRRPEGHVEVLDVFSGELRRVAETYDDFIRNVNERAWQESYLLSEWVYQLHEAGKVPGPGQCYALTPHPILGGPNSTIGRPIDSEFVMLMDVFVWQSICARMFGGG